jgi:hypothetical protein
MFQSIKLQSILIKFKILLGVNLPDHNLLLQKLIIHLQLVTPYVAMIWSRDASTLKNLIEEIIYQIISRSSQVSL